MRVGIDFPLRFLVFCLALGAVTPYRLNFPRVLLPYHPNVPVSFVLEVTHPTGGCFTWRSTRPDIVSVNMLETTSSGCSDKAEIRSVAKPGGVGSTELSSVIFAEDKGSGTTLSCGVTVDEIATISIETTTKVLFVDAAPARMTVDAFNKEGDRFSTLSEIALEWELSSTSSNGEKPLRIVSFEQSTYEAPAEIVKLEKIRKKGYLILIEGVQTGTATLKTKFSDPYLAKVKAHNVELAVVANLLLVPSQDIYMPVHSIVPFKVLIVKQRGTEIVPMPNPSYELKIDENNFGSLDTDTSSVRGLSRGKTAVHLLSSHVDVRAKAGLRPPSTVIHVVDPEAVQWHVSGENWMLETGKQYTMHVELLDEHGNVMFIADNTKFDTKIDESLLRVDQMSNNGTWMLVTPLKPAKTSVFTKFASIKDQNGKEVSQSGRISGEQKVTLVDPVKIIPPVVYLPYIAEKRAEIQLEATGGSGLFDWNVEDMNIASIELNNGKLTAMSLGITVVNVADKRNAKMTSKADIHVVDVTGVGFGETVRETFVGEKLEVNLKVFGIGIDGHQVEMSDCRNVRVHVDVQDSRVLRHVNVDSKKPTIGTGCGTILFDGLTSGDTRITISYKNHKASIDLAVYQKIGVSEDSTAIGLGSTHQISISGGPRPWILDSSTFFRRSKGNSKIGSQFENEMMVMKCGSQEITENVKVLVGNEKSATLPFPLIAEMSVSVCCAKVTRLEILEEKERSAKCPANVHAMLVNSHAKLRLQGHGICEGVSTPLASINGLETKWSSTDSHIAKVEKRGIDGDVTSKSKEGTVVIAADSKGLTAKYEVLVTEGLRIEPARLVLWNEAVSKGTFSINGGSGHFTVENMPTSGGIVSIAMMGRSLGVTPRQHGQITMKIVDACISEQYADAFVRIADIHSLAIEAPQFVEIGQEVEVEIVAQDETGLTFEKGHRPLAEANLETTNSHASIKRINGLRYLLRAESIGTVSLSATSKSSSGRELKSTPKIVQIFSPIFLQPKRLTLIPESKFQLEVVGGPQPTPPLDFALNNSKVATIEPNALITSTNLGYTSITGTVRVGDGHVSKDSVVLRVVSLSGVALSASTRRVETGGRVNIRLMGLVKNELRNEEPFAFGGAHYPFKVTWSVSDPSVLQSTHPLGGDVVESNENQFAIWYDALRSGSVTVKAVVELNEKAKLHFEGRETTFVAELSVAVENGLALVEPEMAVTSVRVAPNSQLKLVTIWPQAAFSVPGEFASKVSISPEGYLRTNGREGSAAIAVRKVDSSDNETVLIPITVSRVYSLDVYPTIELRSASEKSPLLHLPVGAQIQLNVIPRDSRGRKLMAASTSVNYRPHRFDLTDISATNNNHTLTITMKSAGDTVLRIMDSSNIHISTFMRLSASESLLPSAAHKYSNDLVVSDVICLQSKILAQDGTRYSSKSSSEGRVLWLDENLGVGQFVKAGDTFIKLDADQQTIHSKISIGSPTSLEFTNLTKPPLVTNDDNSVFLFAVTGITNQTSKRKMNSIYGECTEEQAQSFSQITPPFNCEVIFERHGKQQSAMNWLQATPVFDKKLGYACEVRKIDASFTSTSIQIPVEMEKEQYAMHLTAKWIAMDGMKNIKPAETFVPFHFAVRVEESELVFSNMDQTNAALSIWAPKHDVSHILVKGCEGDIVSIDKLYAKTDKHSPKANQFYHVRLNVKSAALFSEHAKKCRVVVENRETGQIVNVPVTIQLLDETSKQVYNALDSRGPLDVILILCQRYYNVLPTLIWTVGVGIALIAGILWLRSNVTNKSGSFANKSFNNTMNNTSIASSMSNQTANMSTLAFDSPVFRSTPIAGSPNVNVLSPRERLRAGYMGSSGDGRLWTTDDERTF